ncbi:MAG: roadblock/LC7 domain-containing protein [Cyanobacteria bacterium NC_groundwater_1444_Ag_S-0.65um_54_12]|nr:roadblock/LC7 domain-containing protein [Cyanobacteria bacterium NC_groundwater_1444_Ag_S-0.65um_54_12]
MINRILTNFVVTEEGINRIRHLLKELVEDVDAQTALLIEKSGQIVATDGDIQGLDTTAIASLVSGGFASTRAIARLIGETEFQAMFQQGERASIFMYSLGTKDILVVIFTDFTKTGLVKVQTQQTAVALSAEISQMQGR